MSAGPTLVRRARRRSLLARERAGDAVQRLLVVAQRRAHPVSSIASGAAGDLEEHDGDVVLATCVVRPRRRARAQPRRDRRACCSSSSRMVSSSTIVVRPSEQSTNTSPGCVGTGITSTATSGSVPSARVITERCGWLARLVGRQPARADELGDERVVLRHLLERHRRAGDTRASRRRGRSRPGRPRRVRPSSSCPSPRPTASPAARS